LLIIFFREWESIISNYRGSRPLKNWWEYVQWLQKAYSQDAEHEVLLKTCERCFALFGQKDEYRNDDTYIRIWLTYVNSFFFFFFFFLLDYLFILFLCLILFD
jgi:hypothetical protein